MASEKQLRMKIASTTNIAKITSSMKMVAAAKMRGDEVRLKNGRLFGAIFDRVFTAPEGFEPSEDRATVEVPNSTMLLANSSDKGLCGGINSGVAKATRLRAAELSSAGRDVSISMVGDKARGQLSRESGSLFHHAFDEANKQPVTFATVLAMSEDLASTDASEVEIVFNHYISAIAYEQETKTIPNMNAFRLNSEGPTPNLTPEHLDGYEFEPEDKAEALQSLFEFAVAGQLHTAIVDGNASEQSARMAAMDNASNNATDMIERFTLAYNRARQARITTELTEIVSGAEALNQ
jgi:F-type H+-transporting ATPase subunit gamma